MMLSNLYWIQGIWREKSNFKIFKVMKSTFKTIFSHYPLSSIFNNKFWRFHLDILDTKRHPLWIPIRPTWRWVKRRHWCSHCCYWRRLALSWETKVALMIQCLKQSLTPPQCKMIVAHHTSNHKLATEIERSSTIPIPRDDRLCHLISSYNGVKNEAQCVGMCPI